MTVFCPHGQDTGLECDANCRSTECRARTKYRFRALLRPLGSVRSLQSPLFLGGDLSVYPSRCDGNFLVVACSWSSVRCLPRSAQRRYETRWVDLHAQKSALLRRVFVQGPKSRLANGFSCPLPGGSAFPVVSCAIQNALIG